MIAQNKNFRVSFDSLLDDLLMRICAKLQLTPTQHDLAESRYKSVGEWLLNPSSGLAHLNPRIYSQGSLRIRTSVKPIGRNEYDLDLVCEMDFDWRLVDPLHVLNMLEAALRAHGTYKNMIERKNRCIRLVYANEFYMDILPGTKHAAGPAGAIKVPERGTRTWKDSNPIGYGNWFEGRATSFSMDFAKDMEPLPAPESMDEKPPLKFAVQLLKRNRDLEFKSSMELAPISILLTTLAGHAYTGNRTVCGSMMSILSGINNSVMSIPTGRRLEVRNPANPAEDLSERWDKNRDGFPAFTDWISGLWSDWQEIQGARGNKLYAKLESLFGEEATRSAVKDQALTFGQHRVNEHLGVTGNRVGLSVGASTFITPVKPNTFYGQ